MAQTWATRNQVLSGDAVEVFTPEAVRDDADALLYYKVPLSGNRMMVVAGDTQLSPVIAMVDQVEGTTLPEGHPLEALLARDIPARLMGLTAVKARATGTASASATAAQLSAIEARWEELLGTYGVKARAALSSGNPARVFAYIESFANGQLTHWNQHNWNNYGTWTSGTLYARYAPNHYPAGCVAVVGAALLQHYQTASLLQQVTRTCKVDGVETRLTTKTGSYDWASLPQWKYGVSLTEAQKELLGRVVYDVGVCVEMEYASYGSGAYVSKLVAVLRKDYGFKTGCWAASVDSSHYEKLIYGQLRAGAPVGLTIVDSRGGGHAVTAVGYGKDDGGTSYTRVFMGWGGSGDAWYTLPEIETYVDVVEVGTLISPTEEAIAVYGEVKSATGEPEVWMPVTIAGRTVRTNAIGAYAVRRSFDDLQANKTITVGSQTKHLTMGTDSWIVAGSYGANWVNERLPGAVDFTVEQASGFKVYTSASEARAAALSEDKPVFVLSGIDTDADCQRVQDHLRALGAEGLQDVVLYYCNRAIDASGMAGGCPQYGLFNASTWNPARGWSGNVAMAQDTSPLEANVDAVLAHVPRLADLTLSGATTISGPTTYQVEATFSDGTTVAPVRGLTWSTDAGDVATVDAAGVVTPKGEGEVTLRVSGTYRNEAVSLEQKLRVEASAVRLNVATALDLESSPDLRLMCSATFSNGQTCAITPTWTVTVMSVSPTGGEALTVTVDEAGAIALSRTDFVSAKIVLKATAAFSGKSSEKAISLYPPAYEMLESWEPSLEKLYPGAVVRPTQITLATVAHGVTSTLATPDLEQLEFALYEAEGTPASEPAPAWALPHAGRVTEATPLTLALAMRKKGESAFSSTVVTRTVTVMPTGTTLDEAKGAMPLGWLETYFPSVTTEATLITKAEDDSDGDGYSNWQEYVAGTDPTEASSALCITAILPRENGEVEIAWPEVPGRTYQLLGKEKLSDPTWSTPTANSRFFCVRVEME